MIKLLSGLIVAGAIGIILYFLTQAFLQVRQFKKDYNRLSEALKSATGLDELDKVLLEIVDLPSRYPFDPSYTSMMELLLLQYKHKLENLSNESPGFPDPPHNESV